MISTVIVAHNEAHNLKRCLTSLGKWSDEVVVVDLDSTDNTRAVAESFGCKVVAHEAVPYVERVRNFAIAQCSGDWILILDPDECVTASLKGFLRCFAARNHQGALNIPRKNVFFGHWIRYTNFWPDFQIRFISNGSVLWQEQIHSYPVVFAPLSRLPAVEMLAIQHFGYTSFSDFLKRQERYAAIRAEEMFQSGESFSVWLLVYSAVRELLTRFVLHLGFLDRERGLFLSLALVYYQILVQLNLRKLKNLQLS